MLLDGLPYAPPWTITRAGPFRISRHHYLPEHELLDAHDTTRLAHRHPRGVAYRAPAGARALAHAAERPGSIITGFGALALHGLPYLTEGHDTVLVAPRSANQQGDELLPTVRRRGCSPSDAWMIYIREHPFRVANPVAATIQALKEYPPETLPAVQLVDAARRFLDVGTEEILAAAQYKLRSDWINRIVRMSSQLADSPKETEMRLLVSGIAEQFGITMREQYPVHLSGRLITIFDLVLLEPRIGIMYDGKHHWDYQQRQKDSLINLEVAAQGWTLLRFSAGTLPELPARLERLLNEKLRPGGLPSSRSGR